MKQDEKNNTVEEQMCHLWWSIVFYEEITAEQLVVIFRQCTDRKGCGEGGFGYDGGGA